MKTKQQTGIGLDVDLIADTLIRCAERIGFRVEKISKAQTGTVYVTLELSAYEPDSGRRRNTICGFPPSIRLIQCDPRSGAATVPD